jgi:hypothetical protein
VQAARDAAQNSALGAAIRSGASARDAVAWAAERTGQDAARQRERQGHAALLRCILGNPFRPTPLDPAWRTRDVLALARVAYEQRALPSGELDTSRLGILADALEEAGCIDAGILDHLHDPGLHVRGCWAVDLLTGRE